MLIAEQAATGCHDDLDVTVSVVVYRDYDTPLMMIKSLMRETPHAIRKKIYVVDNSSGAHVEDVDAQRDFLLDFVESQSDIEYIDAGGNLGFGRSNNIALFKSSARYHAFVNPDIVFEGDALGPLIAYLEANENVGMVIPQIVDEEGNIQKAYREEVTLLDALNRTLLRERLRKRASKHTMEQMDYSQTFRVPFGQGCFLMGRTRLLKMIGGFDESYFLYLEDADLCKRINEVSRLMYVPEARVVHKWQRASHSNLRLARIHLKSYVRYFKKWGYTFS